MLKYLVFQAIFVLVLYTQPLFGSLSCNTFFKYNLKEFVSPRELIHLPPYDIAHILKTQYTNLKIVPHKANREFINNTKSENPKDFYFDGSFAYIKELNDSIGDKALVTALVNFHKMILIENLFGTSKVEHPLIKSRPLYWWNQ
ncbi:hypothetical protein N9W41_00135 [bacterium]|nr:hypothetical protein [bacterium]